MMKKSGKIRITIADDHPIFRKGLKQMLGDDENIIIVGESDNGIDALKQIKELKPDIALLDIEMPGMTGIETLREIRKLKEVPKIVFLTVYADEDIYDEGVELGISGYVLKDSAVSDIIECINHVHDGKYYISPSVADFLFNKKKKNKREEEEKKLSEILTKTELYVLKLISESRTTREISGIMDISFKTAENHRTNISAKLGLKGANSLLKFAIENREQIIL